MKIETSNIKSARRTEWFDIVYRSKSEALFSVFLWKAGFKVLYEPEWLEVNNWTPDFLITGFSNWHIPGKSQPILTIIEYKPKETTDTYRKNLIENFKILAERFSIFPFNSVMFELWQCPFWGNGKWSRFQWRLYEDGDFIELFQIVDPSDWIDDWENVEEFKKSVRFDLKHQ